MLPTQDTYPVFEANQVLTNTHLNQVFDYLDKQERLTRTHLIGIGIVCGLDVRLEQTGARSVIHLTKGCGITSEGYLILEPEDVALVAYRERYVSPTDPAYRPFIDPGTNRSYPLWELFPAGEPGVRDLGDPAGFLADKAVLLFLELKKDNLRNCSPVNCDDRGILMTATVRRLLVATADLAKITASGNRLGRTLTTADIETALLTQLNLPDLRLPRYDVPNTRPTTSQDVLAGFHAIFHENKLVQQTANALSAAYQAFRPVVGGLYGADPFANFGATFGFLDAVPTTTAQVRFLQYYYDFFGDLLQAYDEFRWKGIELLCVCCPPADLFPRHLMAGVLVPASVANPGVYRHRFLGSAAVSGCEERTNDVEQLFRRLVELIVQFTPAPALPRTGSATDEQIRIVPSQLADVPLSAKAIPYYYRQTGTPPLFQLWNPQQSRRNRANQNLSYRADEYNPPAPPFVINPLRYDLEPYNFLRIEGHLGKGYQSALSTLLSLKARHRLPIDIITLRTGAFDDKMPVDLTKETARFQDLETLYDAIREEMLSALAEGTRYFYGVSMNGSDPEGTAQLPLLKKYAPNFRYQKGTVGAWYEKHLATLQAVPYIDVDHEQVSTNTVWTVFCLLFQNTSFPPNEFYPHVVSVYYCSKLAEILPDSLSQLGFADFENKYEDLIALVRYFRSEAVRNFPAELAKFLPQEELIDQFDQVLFACKLEPMRALRDEYKRRIRAIKQKQFLGYFLQTNPGIQHKAGVPMGGTFILVYHDDPDPLLRLPGLKLPSNLMPNRFVTQSPPDQADAPFVNAVAVSEALTRISAKQQFAIDPDIRFLLSTLTGQAPDLRAVLPGRGGEEAGKIIDKTVDELTDGTVIADFYLPYLLSADGGVQFVLPKRPPTFTVSVGCTNANKQAEVTLTPDGGMAPYSYKADDGDFTPLRGTFPLSEGNHTVVIRDAEATESGPQPVEVTGQLTLGRPDFECIDNTNGYVVTAGITGGTPPYGASRGTVTGNQYSSDALPGNQDLTVTITDSRQCTVTQTFNHSCLPELAFRTEVGCTSPEQGAPVQILPTGGTAPYQVRVGAATGRFDDLTGPLSLAVGTHTIVVRDAAGTVTPPQTVVVLPPLRLSATRFECEGTATYRADIQITGGTPPYTVRGQELTGNTFATDPVASGKPFSAEVTDKSGCSATLEDTHTCDACNLPCGGESRRSAYRLWVQPPREGSQYKSYKPDKITVRYNGTAFDLPLELVAMPVGKLNGDFNNTVGEAIKKLNEAIASTIGRGRVELSYRPDTKDPFALLYIEHFVCETFSVSFRYSLATPEPQQNLNVAYTNEPAPTGAPFDGTVFVNLNFNNKETRLPAFDGRERNQCSGSDYTTLCDETAARLSAAVEPLGNNRFVLIGTVEGVPEGEILAWIWDAPAAQPAEPFYVGKKVEAQLNRPGSLVRLTAITQKGCFTTVDQTIG